MEEEFEKKTNKKFLKILLPIIVLIVLIGGLLGYYFINTTPKNVFNKVIDGVFANVKEEKYETLKTNLELSMSIESDDSDIKSFGQMINSVKVETNQEIDITNKVANEAISISLLGQDLLNFEYIIKDKTTYMFLKDIFSKYIEIPLEDIGYEEDIFAIIEETIKITSKDVASELNEIIKTELKDKTYEQTKEELEINGEKIKTTKSTLVLTPKEVTDMLAAILSKVKDNDIIMNNFSGKEEIKSVIKEVVDGINEASDEIVAENGEKIKLSIYTKGIKNEFVRFDIDLVNNDEVFGLYIKKVSDNNYLVTLNQENEELLYISIKDEKKNEKSGTMTIKVDMSNALQEMSDEIKTLAIVLEGKYNVEYNTKVEIPKITDSVIYDEMTEEDMMEIMENLQKTELYTLLEQSGLIDTSYLEEQTTDFEEVDTMESEVAPEVTFENYKVKYNVPAGFITSAYNTPDYKYYSDEHLNSVTVTIEKETKNNYLEFLKESYTLTSDTCENQEISGIKTLNVGGKEFSYRTITYSIAGYNYTELYYCYELDDGYLYVVEANIEDGTIAETELNRFLEIQI